MRLAIVISSPSSTHATPSAITSRLWNLAQGSRSMRAGTRLRTTPDGVSLGATRTDLGVISSIGERPARATTDRRRRARSSYRGGPSLLALPFGLTVGCGVPGASCRGAPRTPGGGTTKTGRPRRLEPGCCVPPGSWPPPGVPVCRSSAPGGCSTGRPRRCGAGCPGDWAPPADAKSSSAATITSRPRSPISSHAQLSLRHVAQEHVFGSLARLVVQQALEALAHFLARHEDPVGLQDLADHLVVRLDRLRHREIAVRPRAAARPQVERRHLEEGEVRLARLEQDDVALEARIVLVLLDAELQARV